MSKNWIKSGYNVWFVLCIVLYTMSGVMHGLLLISMIVEIAKEPLTYYYDYQTKYPGFLNSIREYWIFISLYGFSAFVRTMGYVNLYTVHNVRRWKRTFAMGIILIATVMLEWAVSLFAYNQSETIETCRNLIFFTPYLLFAIYQKKMCLKEKL